MNMSSSLSTAGPSDSDAASSAAVTSCVNSQLTCPKHSERERLKSFGPIPRQWESARVA